MNSPSTKKEIQSLTSIATMLNQKRTYRGDTFPVAFGTKVEVLIQHVIPIIHNSMTDVDFSTQNGY